MFEFTTGVEQCTIHDGVVISAAGWVAHEAANVRFLGFGEIVCYSVLRPAFAVFSGGAAFLKALICDLGELLTKPKPASRFKLFVESFGVLTSAAFVASGAVNGLIFYFNYDLNYFQIASPSDVVMSGFIFVTLLLLILGTGIAVAAIVTASRNMLEWAVVQINQNVRINPNFLKPIGSQGRRKFILSIEISEIKSSLLALSILIMLSFTSLIFFITQTTNAIYKPLSQSDSNEPLPPPPNPESTVPEPSNTAPDPGYPTNSGTGYPTNSGGFIAPSNTGGNSNGPTIAVGNYRGTSTSRKSGTPIPVAIPPKTFFSYQTGLRLVPTDEDDPCWAAAVLWMGSDRAVLGCRVGIRVVKLTDDLKMEPIQKAKIEVDSEKVRSAAR